MRMEINILHCIQNQENLLDISIRRLQKLSNNRRVVYAKVRKLVTTIMIAALITAMEGTTISQLSHYVKADTNTTSQTSQAENDLTQYKKINGIGDNTVLGEDFPIINCKNAWKKSGKITKESKFPMCLNM